MLEVGWINQRVGIAYVYWESRVPQEDLLAKCVERVMEMIKTYKEDEDPEQYQEIITQRVQFLMAR